MVDFEIVIRYLINSDTKSVALRRRHGNSKARRESQGISNRTADYGIA